MAAPDGDSRLRGLVQLLRSQAASPLAPYVTFHYLHLRPSAHPLLDSLTTRFTHE
jgi:hypothetical protein